MDLKNSSLNIYSFGYAAGFIKDERFPKRKPAVNLDTLVNLTLQYRLGGIEFPFDYFFGTTPEEGIAYIRRVQEKGLRVAIDFETLDAAVLNAVLPELKKCGISWARIKMKQALYGGNRYRVANFETWKQEFIADIQSVLDVLNRLDMKLLIENHQDVGSVELLHIIQVTSPGCIGINWDIGNSLAVGETPTQFFKRAEPYIGNIHLKDYQIVRGEDGIGLTRCALGKGVVDFEAVFNHPTLRAKRVPMSIELGAQNTRWADISLKKWWTAYPQEIQATKGQFLKFVNGHLQGEDFKGTAWEHKQAAEDIEESEQREMGVSVDFLKGLDI